ncbi:cytochrome c oxidase subunit IVB [Oceanobacillus iheyensis]|uniref:Cytochrome c oxidase subunit IV (Aa3 type) n=1 Tax=Oceanobacillus iheyensis (strain DSM 14371 / CIP 107618 / JCM 11309 / KCTC 3954 / HTE831) TaxID=221109 RepID=Q8ER74_OCEIH|nr:cytochrome c oxidase subunit IVB [Oceanobacillus iheyensis]BAC13396.1 cytochrome c oxidase subunit IV (aa3 type) [Oceanobacillus iheyensis HTE831]
MTDNMSTRKINSFQKAKNKEEMKKQIVTFALMIFFTLIAFFAVMLEIDKMFVIPLLLILAVVQIAFQFFYFMHMKDKGHEVPSQIIYGGIFVTMLVILTFTVITWW